MKCLLWWFQQILFSGLWTGWLLQTSSQKLEIAVFYEEDRPEILSAVDLARTRLAADVGNPWNANQLNVTIHRFPINLYNRYAVVDDMCDPNRRVNYSAILDVTTRGGACISLSIAQQFDAPFMTLMGERCYLGQTYTTRFPNAAYFYGASRIVFGRNATGVEGVAVFFDYTFDIAPILPLQDITMFIPTYLFELPPTDGEMLDLLAKVKKETACTEFLVFSSTRNASRMLNASSLLGLNQGVFHWFIFTRDFQNFTCTTCVGSGVVYIHHIIKNVTLYQALRTAVTKANVSINALGYQMLDVFYAYQSTLTLLEVIAGMNKVGKWNGTTSLSVCDEPTTTPLNRFLAYADQLKNYTSQYPGVVAEVAFNGNTASRSIEFAIEQCRVGQCVDLDDRYIYLNNSLTKGSFNLTYQLRANYTVLVIPDPPFVFKYPNGTYDGFSISVLNYMANKLGFDFTLREPKDGAYGILGSDGQWNGAIGEIANGEADMAFGAFSITAEREQVVDFSIPYSDYSGLQMLMLDSNSATITGSNNMFYFLTVFEGWVWLCIGITLLVTGVLVTIFDKLSPFSFQNKTIVEEGEPEGKIFTFKESMWFVLGAYTQAGESFDPRATSTRMLVAGFWLFSCIMMAMYTANLAAFLTVSKLNTDITTIQALAAQTDIKYSVIANTAGQTFFQRMKDIEGTFYDVWKNITEGNEFTIAQVSKYSVWEYPIEERYTDMFTRMSYWGFPNSTEQAMKNIRDGNYAIFIETTFIKYFQNQHCDLFSTGEVLGSRPYGIVLQDKSPLTNSVNLIILEMQSNRELETMKVNWWSKDAVDCPPKDNNSGIRIQTLGGVFIVLAAGIVLGGIVLIIEIIVAKTIGVERFKPEPENAVMGHFQPKPLPGGAYQMNAQSSVSVRLHSPRPIIQHRPSVTQQNSMTITHRVEGGHLAAPHPSDMVHDNKAYLEEVDCSKVA